MSITCPIKIKEFVKTYPSKTIHIHNLEIHHRVTILKGENGSGKSTLLKGLMNLISYEGNIENAYSLSYMPENPFFPLDITLDDFLCNLTQKKENEYNYKQLIALFQLEDKVNERINTLSKGMKAKLNLVQCLMKGADIYILDEPLSGLDDQSVKLLIEYMNKSEKSFIISSHIDRSFKELNRKVIHINEHT